MDDTLAPNPLQLHYRPRDPQRRDQPIGLIGCGGITHHHLNAYRAAGYPVVALCDVDPTRAEARRAEFFPEARVYTDYRQLLRNEEVRVVDVATHPTGRGAILAEVLATGRHVLSQKPFVLDLDEGQRLVELADRHGVRLAVNQNGRWAPHWRYALEAVRTGLLGQLTAIHLDVHWDHSWVAGTPFDQVRHLILYDYAIHSFDIVQALAAPRHARRVYAVTSRSPWQTIMPPLQAQAVIEYDDLQVGLTFDGNTLWAPENGTFLAGERGSLYSRGPSDREQQVILTTAAGEFRPELQGSWFPDGFHGTMGELLCSIEENREPSISAAANLESLALCFAAVASAETHQPQVPGTVRQLSD